MNAAKKIEATHSAAIIDGLLDTLLTERFVRAALLRNLVDELDILGAREASRIARSLLLHLERRQVSQGELVRDVARVRASVRAASARRWPRLRAATILRGHAR